jgi:hypothetical protein
VGDPRLAQGRRWRVLWVHHEAEELRVHYRETIPEMTARHVIVDLLASGQVARVNAGRLVTRPPGSRPILQRFWGTVEGRRGSTTDTSWKSSRRDARGTGRPQALLAARSVETRDPAS